MKCPICDKVGTPRCPFFKKCKYRIKGIASTNICWKKPTYCDEYNREIRLAKRVSWNPSMREET